MPLGQAAVRREGGDLTIVAYSLMAHRVLEAADALAPSVSAEVIDPRTLDPFDLQTVLTSVRKTGRLLVVHEAPRRCGMGADIVRQVIEADFGALRSAPRVIAGRDLPMPFAKSLETACIPQVDDIVAAAEQMARAC